ncbi:MAG: L-dopachrome tautomerase-related protein [Bacteroidales bacterium]
MKLKYTLILLLILFFSYNHHIFAQEKGVEEIAQSKNQWTGIAVSKAGRLFVNFPRWSDNVPISVGVIEEGKVIPFPNKRWNRGKSKKSFVAVQSVFIDRKDRLWVLDTRNPQFKGVIKGGPILFCFDSKKGIFHKAYHFPESVYFEDSYFNDVRIDEDRGFAFITDSGHGGIIVLNLRTEESRRLLSDDPSVKSEENFLVCNHKVWKNSVDSDGIALTPDRQYLYYIALTSHTLYRIKTEDLLDITLPDYMLAKKVERVASVPATDGMLFDPSGNLWMGGLEENAINMWSPKLKTLYRVFKDPSIRWADSFTIDHNGDIYFTTSQIYLPEGERKEYGAFKFNYRNLPKKEALNKVLIAITSHGSLGESSGDTTGYYLSEVSHAYFAFRDAGFDVTFVSPKGGESPLTGRDIEDSDNLLFLTDPEAQKAVKNSLKASEVNPDNYRAIYFAGGHGVMWDFPSDSSLQRISRNIYETGGVVSAVCHGPAALINVMLSDGSYLINGKSVSTFTNSEEKAIKLDTIVPFPLETALQDNGAQIKKTDNFKSFAVVDGRLVTGQNPASARKVAFKVIKLLK